MSGKIIKMIASLAAASLLLLFLKAGAQQNRPQFLVTWKAPQNYAPAEFSGKVLPTAGSRIIVSFDLVDGGKLQNLSKQTIYWYLDDNFLAGGDGMQSTTFTVPETASDFLALRIQLPNYGSSLIFKTIQIPVANPSVVIEAPYPNKTFNDVSVKVRANPYFFNMTSLSKLRLAWSVNGEVAQNAENPFELTVNINSDAPSGSTVNIGAIAQNSRRTYEVASGNVVLKLSK
jgi:hypothetical protein